MDNYYTYLLALSIINLGYWCVAKRVKKQVRQEVWDFVISLFAFVWTYRLILASPGFLDIGSTIKTYNPEAHPELEEYTQFQCAYYTLATVLEVANLPHHPDMFIHHLISAPMFAAAHRGRLSPLALVMMVTTIPSSPILSLAKLAKLYNHPYQAFLGMMFAITFFLARVVAYPILVVAQVLPMQPPPSVGILIGQLGGSLLYVMQLIWMAKIVKLVTRHKNQNQRA